MIKQCIICGKDFKASPSDKKVTCGKIDCVRINKSRTHQGKRNVWGKESKRNLSVRGQTANLSKGTPAAKISPIAGSFETNINAKDWVLVSPDGKEYKCRNLNLWAKNNCDLFDRTPAQIAAGFKQIKRHCEGKTKRTVTSYLGWGLKDWGD
jgi:hypothetical protein